MNAPRYRLDERLKEWATARQAEYIDAVNKHRSIGGAAKALGINKYVITEGIKNVEKKAAIFGYSPRHDMSKTVPEPFIVRGVSTYYDKEGKAAGQWVKSRVDEDKREAMIREAIKTLTDDIKGLAPAVKAPSRTESDLLVCYPAGDPHFGLYAWAKETGEAFDLTIARDLTLGAVDRLLASAPNADIGVILPLGDVFHADDQSNATPGHKHQLDVDSRFVKVLGIGIETYRHMILRALEKHQRVIVRFVQGNHDPHSVWALAFTMSAYFSNEPRVEVDLSPSKFWYYRFCDVLIGSTHGDTVKHDALPGIMASDRAADWGATRHRYWYTGHVHHQSVREYPGVICESFRTLAARDAWAAGHGYRAGRDMVAIVHHKLHGEIERHRCDIGMLQN